MLIPEVTLSSLVPTVLAVASEGWPLNYCVMYLGIRRGAFSYCLYSASENSQ